MIKIAKLFECGEYPDKNITVTEKDLAEYVKNFVPCPIKIEHGDTAFDGTLGIVRSIFSKGRELFGKIDFQREAWNLIEKAGAKSLSVSINPGGKFISEVSIVKNPRVGDARVFSRHIEFWDEKGENDLENYENILKENEKLRDRLADMEAERLTEKFSAEGRLLPANRDIAKEILKCDSEIKFGSENMSVSRLFISFLEKEPKKGDFSRLERKIKRENDTYSEEQMRFAEKLGVKLGGEI